MDGSMLRQKISKLGYMTFYFASSARIGCFRKGVTGLCWKGIFRLGVNARWSQHVVNHEINTIIMTLTIPEYPV